MKLLMAALVIASLVTSCRFFGGERIRGNGNIITVQRNAGSFNSIEASGAMEVRVKQDAAHSVSVKTDENLFEFLDIFTDGGTLVIKPKKGYNLNPSDEVIVFVSAPRFEALDVSGASKIISEGRISGDELELAASGASEISMDIAVSKLQADLSGSSTLQLRGSAARFTTEASGASEISCMDLNTDETTLDVSGSTEARVNANKQLTIEASGASNIEYRGNPNVSQNSSGASSVRKVS